MFGSLASAGLNFGLNQLGSNIAFNKSGDKAAEMFQWQLEADGKKYRRAVKDLKAAGLNPMLAVGGGIHGGSPSAGSAPQASAVQADIPSNTHSAIAAKKMNQEIKNLKAIEQQIYADSRLKNKQGNVQDNIDRTTDVLAEGMDALMTTMGGKGTGTSTAKDLRKELPSILNRLKRAPKDYGRFFKQKLKGEL